MYKFKVEMKNELLQGRTLKYIADKTGYSIVHICNVFKGKSHCSTRVANEILELTDTFAPIEKYFEKI